MEEIYATKETVRAVAVAGETQAFIEVLNNKGEFSAADVQAKGYTLISNEIKIDLKLPYDNLSIEIPNPKCPPRTLV